MSQIRIDKLLAHLGYGSRKEVKGLLKSGNVICNEQKIMDAKTHVNPDSDEIIVAGEKVVYKRFVYFMMHKPQGVISATEDLKEKTVIDLLNREDQVYHVHPVGRLDKNTEGLLLLTNDGQLSHQLLSPKHHVPKLYVAKIQGVVTEADVEAFKNGVTLDDGYVTKPSELTIVSSGEVSEVEITIIEGKFHQIKRMFEAVDKKVIYLKRVKMGSLSLDPALSLGSYRELTNEEVERLIKKI